MKYKIIFLFVFTISNLLPQQFSNWKNFTDMKLVSGVQFSDGEIWAASDGGAFKFIIDENSFKTFTKADGLQGITLTSLTIDSSGRVWFGSKSGVLDIVNDKTGSFKVILDIANSNQINKRINYLNTFSDTIIVSSDFGVSLIDANSFLFFDTFFKFGNFTTNTRVNYTNKFGLLYVCTDEGVAIQKEGATNLSAPESWNVYTTSNGLPSNKALKVIKYQGDIIVSTDKGLSKFNGVLWQPFIQQFNDKVISDLTASGDSLLILSENIIYIYKNNTVQEFFAPQFPTSRFTLNNDGNIVGATNNGILYLTASLSDSYLVPNGPAANQFLSITVGENGILWSASGRDGAGVGFYTFDKKIWNNYNRNTTPALPSNDVYRVYASPDNIGYLGTWGHGFVRTDETKFETFNQYNSGMQGIPENPDFLVITGFTTDSRNNLWILNFAAADRKTLSMLTPDSVWYHFSIPAAQNRTLNQHFNLDIDPYDTKWYSSNDASRKGIYYFNEMKTYDDASDDRSGFFTTVDGLNSNEIRSITVDRRGDVWIGTGLGVNVISNTSSITSSNGEALRISSVFSLRQQSINAIAVDPLNQKWVATNQGLLLVNSDGSRLIAALDSKNSPLLSDKIISIAIDDNAGIVYAATENGLTSFETPFIKPAESFDKLFVYPNPYYIPDGSKLLTIDGLIRDTELKILTIDGRVVSQFFSPGGRTAYWDGRDDDGNLVNSGVYLIVAFDRDGNNIVTGKVAVLRR